MDNESQNDSKIFTFYLVSLYTYLSLIFFIASWFTIYFTINNKIDFIISTLYFSPIIIILLTYLFRHRTLKFAYKYENEIKLLGPFMRLFLYIFTTRFFYGANGTRTMKAIYVFCFQASLISFYVSFTIRNGHYLSSLFLFGVLESLFSILSLEFIELGKNIVIKVVKCDPKIGSLKSLDNKKFTKQENILETFLSSKTRFNNNLEIQKNFDNEACSQLTDVIVNNKLPLIPQSIRWVPPLPTSYYYQYCVLISNKYGGVLDLLDHLMFRKKIQTLNQLLKFLSVNLYKTDSIVIKVEDFKIKIRNVVDETKPEIIRPLVEFTNDELVLLIILFARLDACESYFFKRLAYFNPEFVFKHLLNAQEFNQRLSFSVYHKYFYSGAKYIGEYLYNFIFQKLFVLRYEVPRGYDSTFMQIDKMMKLKQNIFEKDFSLKNVPDADRNLVYALIDRTYYTWFKLAVLDDLKMIRDVFDSYFIPMLISQRLNLLSIEVVHQIILKNNSVKVSETNFSKILVSEKIIRDYIRGEKFAPYHAPQYYDFDARNIYGIFEQYKLCEKLTMQDWLNMYRRCSLENTSECAKDILPVDGKHISGRCGNQELEFWRQGYLICVLKELSNNSLHPWYKETMDSTAGIRYRNAQYLSILKHHAPLIFKKGVINGLIEDDVLMKLFPACDMPIRGDIIIKGDRKCLMNENK